VSLVSLKRPVEVISAMPSRLRFANLNPTQVKLVSSEATKLIRRGRSNTSLDNMPIFLHPLPASFHGFIVPLSSF
jgi:hypothetical protein